ncbi:MAG: MCE family protein [Candidatus Eisenbacteria bacterium]|nr:MCE family protein [Candidatus Eisenbacteria bacterium]
MTEHSNEVRVGITLTAAGAILVIGILWLGGFTFGDNRYEFKIMFAEVAGLGAGDKVTVAGIDAGEILTLQLAPFGKVVAEVSVDDYIKIPDDSRIAVASYGLIGAKVISIKPGRSSTYIEPGTVVQGQYEKGLGDVVNDMGEALTGIRQVLRSADDILTDQEGKDLFKNALSNVNDASADLKDASAVLKVMADDLGRFISEQKDPAATTIGAVGSAATGFAEVTEELKLISATLDSIVTRVDEGQGTLGRLINEDEAYEEFLTAVSELRSLVEDIRNNPKGFVKFSLF